jgi:hypothetical protein
MKKLTFTLIFVISTICVNAQIINFPDANFKAKLLEASTENFIAKNAFDEAIKIDANNNGEIEVNEAENVTYLDVSYSSIQFLEGISNFTNLTYLSCSNNQLTSLNVDELVNLNELYCFNNQIQSLNATELVNLTKLMCENNQLSSLAVSGLVNLEHLSCSTNQLISLDLSGLVNLEALSSSYNQLTSLYVSGLINLSYLSCGYNQLSNLDVSGLINLNTFQCSYNQISSLNINELVNLNFLYCEFNQLQTLDTTNIISLYELDCRNNQLTSLFIKDGINNPPLFGGNPNLLYICADEIELDFILSSYDILSCPNVVVNSYCSFVPGGLYYTIQGQQKFDNESDGCDIDDNTFPNLKFSITNGTTTGTLISDNTGNYFLPVQAGTHNITPILENPSYFTVSPTNVVVNFPTETSPFTQNFCITPNGNHHDVEVSIIPTNSARPGFDAFYKIIYKNKGNQIENGTVNLQFNDGVLDVVSTNPVFTTQTVNNLSFNYSNLNPFETREINVVLTVNSPMETPAVNGGDILNFTATNTITNTDEMLSDNTFVLNQTVVNSYDPNDKTCLQGNYVSPDKIGEFVHYVIRFENTGTFPAENIVVKDMIDNTKFDVSSLVPLHASHNYVTRISGNNVEFIFENINLPFDDATNDGYVSFKIKTLPSLVVGNTFSNTANIYFDYNFPIVTNTATTTIAALNNPSFEFTNYFSLYPNPTANELNISLKSAIEINSIQIYNTIGQLVTVQTGNALKADVSNLKTGNYFIKINTNEGFSTSQFIKE